jgi:LmbE family N-acetylglucosaminyl deacetylase
MPGLLALLAHPDDEFFCGGLLAALGARGVPIHLAYWTRGEGGMSPRRRVFAKCFPRAWHPRACDARRAAEVLGAASVTFLGAIDPIPAPEPRAPDMETPEVIGKVARLVSRHAPELLVTHGSQGEYGHPAHIRLHQIAREFLRKDQNLPWATFCASAPEATGAWRNVDDRADYIRDTRAYARKKMEIVRAHRSQRGALEALAKPGGGLRNLLRSCRYEAYRCWGGEAMRQRGIDRLKAWTV